MEARNARRRLIRQSEHYRRMQDVQPEGSAAGARFGALSNIYKSMAGRLYKGKKGYDLDLLSRAQHVRASRRGDLSYESDAIMKSYIGGRIYAATADVWRGLPYDDWEGAILDEFGVGSIEELIVFLEGELGESFYSADTSEKYDEVLTRILEMRRGA